MRICIFSRNYSPDFNKVIQTIIDLVNETKGQIVFCNHLSAKVKAAFKLPLNTIFLKKGETVEGIADLVVSLGGDGTLLETVNLIADSEVPVMGVNFGRLGFLSNLQKDEFRNSIIEFFNGNYSVSSRTILEIDECKQYFKRKLYALNEVSIFKSCSNTMISIGVWINNEFVNNYWSDGIILSTPTGSTAYSLSCGGPIMIPEAKNFVLTPIAPHNLSVRPIVISDDDIVTFIPEGRTEDYILSLDSNQALIKQKQKVTIRKAPFSINFVRRPKDSFWGILRDKLMWGEDKRNM